MVTDGRPAIGCLSVIALALLVWGLLGYIACGCLRAS